MGNSRKWKRRYTRAKQRKVVETKDEVVERVTSRWGAMPERAEQPGHEWWRT